MKVNFKNCQEMVDEWEKKQELKSHTRLILNRIKTPDGTILTSYNRHDYITYVDKNGLEYMVDGGLDYLRRNIHLHIPGSEYEELSVTDSAPFEQIRESLHWGTYGKKQDQLLKYVPLCEMSDDHIKNIIDLEFGSEWIRGYFREEMIYRKSICQD